MMNQIHQIKFIIKRAHRSLGLLVN